MKLSIWRPSTLGWRRFLKSGVLLSLAIAFFPSSLWAQNCAAIIGAPACSSAADPGSTSAGFLPSPYVANPVDVVSGNKYQHSDDYLAFGSRLQFSRHYNSADSEERGVLGAGWRHSFDVSLNRASPSRLLIKQSDGRILEFIGEDESAAVYRARHAADGYVEVGAVNKWFLPSGKTLTFKGSFLVEVVYADDRKLRLNYKNTQLQSVSDHFDRAITLHYYPGKKTLASYDDVLDGGSPGYLEYVVLPDGSRIDYAYDKRQNLVSVSYPEGTQSLYEYKDADFNQHMTGAYEALESTQKHWKYDHYGRAIQHSNESAEFTVDIDFAPPSDKNKQSRTRVSTSDGWQADYGWQHSKRVNLPYVSDYQEQACPSCKPTQKTFTEKSVLEWQPLPPAAAPSSQQKTVDKNTRHETQTVQYYDFAASDGVLGGVLTLRQADVESAANKNGNLKVTVDRVGKIRDMSDGQHSLSHLKQELLYPSSTQDTGDSCGKQNAGDHSKTTARQDCAKKLIKLLRVTQSAEKQFRIPAINSPANQALNNRFCAVTTQRNCDQLRHDYKMAQLSACVYHDNPCGNGYVKVDPLSIGMSADEFEYEGFKAVLYKDLKTGEMVLAFRGTDGWNDLKDNIAQGLGKKSDYYRRAIGLAVILDEKLNGGIHLTGHSLGGGLASAAAFETSSPTTVFNSAALHPSTVSNYSAVIGNADKIIVSYTVKGDTLSKLQDIKPPTNILKPLSNWKWPFKIPGKPSKTNPNKGPARTTFAAPGQRIELDSPSDQWMAQNTASKFNISEPKGLVLHSISAVIESLKTKVLAVCKTLVRRS